MSSRPSLSARHRSWSCGWRCWSGWWRPGGRLLGWWGAGVFSGAAFVVGAVVVVGIVVPGGCGGGGLPCAVVAARVVGVLPVSHSAASPSGLLVAVAGRAALVWTRAAWVGGGGAVASGAVVRG